MTNENHDETISEQLQNIENAHVFVCSIPKKGWTRTGIIHITHAFKFCDAVIVWLQKDQPILHAHKTKMLLTQLEARIPREGRHVGTFYGDAEELHRHVNEICGDDETPIQLIPGGYHD